jgi:hypothetical protein
LAETTFPISVTANGPEQEVNIVKQPKKVLLFWLLSGLLIGVGATMLVKKKK